MRGLVLALCCLLVCVNSACGGAQIVDSSFAPNGREKARYEVFGMD